MKQKKHLKNLHYPSLPEKRIILLLCCLIGLVLSLSATMAYSSPADKKDASIIRTDRYFVVFNIKNNGQRSENGEVVISDGIDHNGKTVFQRILMNFKKGMRVACYFTAGPLLDRVGISDEWGFPMRSLIIQPNSKQWIYSDRTHQPDLWATSLHPDQIKTHDKLNEADHDKITTLIQQARMLVCGLEPGFAPIRVNLDGLANWFSKMGEPEAPLDIKEINPSYDSSKASRIRAIEDEFGKWATWGRLPRVSDHVPEEK